MDKVLSLMGLAKRAGKVTLGETAVKESIRYGKTFLVVIADDASENTKKSIINSCKYYDVKYYIRGTKESVGHALGKSFCVAASINDEGFAESIERYLQPNTNGGEVL